MFKNNQRRSWLLGFILILVLWGLLLLRSRPERVVLGAEKAITPTMPTGTDLSRILISDSARTFSNNSARVTARPDNTSLITLTSGTQQTGAVWAADGAYFDLNRETHLGFWMRNTNYSNYPGEGFAFVLQNDTRGSQAITSFMNKPVLGGESLGVWAADLASNQTEPQLLALSAIQRSWALEFDSHGNLANGSGAPGKGNSFDLGTAGSSRSHHIAANYPSRQETYLQRIHRPWFSANQYYYTMNHGDLLVEKPNLTSPDWQHVSLIWDPETQMMTFSWDDRDPQTGALKPSFKSQAVPLDQSVFASGNGRVRWGFTATTSSSNYERTELILDRVPGGVRGFVRSELFNETRQEQVRNNASVHTGDLLTATYRLDYLPSLLPWEQIDINIDLPKQTHFMAGGEIKHANGKTRPLNAQWLQKEPKTGEQWLAFHLIEPLTPDNYQVEIKVKLQADQYRSGFSVAPALAAFNTPHLRLNTATPRYELDPKRLITTTDDAALEYYVSQNDPLPKIHGEFSYTTALTPKEPLAIENSDFAIKRTLNGQLLSYEPVSTLSQQNGRFQLANEALNTSQLHPGVNEFTYCLVDKFANHSNVKTIKIILMSGQLRFGTIAENVAFADAQVTGSKQLIARRPDWEIEVFDDRQQGDRVTAWQLLAQATPLKQADGRVLAGEMVYVEGLDQQSLDAPLIVAQKNITDLREATNVVTDRWQDNEGILLKLRANAIAGNYSGKIIWTLQDDPSQDS